MRFIHVVWIVFVMVSKRSSVHGFGHKLTRVEHCVVQEQKATIAELNHGFAQQQKQIEALTAGLQKVSAQIELSKLAPQTVLNSQ